MNRFFWLVLAIVAVLIPGDALAGEKAAGPMEVYQLARQRDAAWAASKAERDEGVEKAEQGRALMLPRLWVEAGVSYNNQYADYKGADILRGGQSSYGGYSLSVTLAQPLYRAPNSALAAIGKEAALMAEFNMRLNEQDLIIRTARAYFNILLAHEALELIEAQKQAISERLEMAKKSFELGAASVTDTHEAQARFDLVISREISVRQSIEIAKEDLVKITGEADMKLATLKEGFSPSPPPLAAEAWADEAIQAHPYIKIMEKNLAIAGQEVERAEGERMPAADVVANYSHLNQGGGSFGLGMENTNQSISLKFSVPVYSGGAISSKIREARAGLEKSRSRLEETRRQVRLQVRVAHMRMLGLVSEVSALEQALISSDSALSSTKKGFEVGLRSAVDVLDAQRQYFDAKHSLAVSRYNYILSYLALMAAAGTLSEEGLETVAEYLKKR